MSRRSVSYQRPSSGGGYGSNYSGSPRNSLYGASPTYSGRYGSSATGLTPSLNLYSSSYKPSSGYTSDYGKSGYGSDYGHSRPLSGGYGSDYGRSAGYTSDYGANKNAGYISDYGRSGHTSDYGRGSGGYTSDYAREHTTPSYGRQGSFSYQAPTTGYASYSRSMSRDEGSSFRRPSTGSVANAVKMFASLPRQDNATKPPVGRSMSVYVRSTSREDRPPLYRQPSRETSRSVRSSRQKTPSPPKTAAPLTRSESKGRGGLAPADFTSDEDSEEEETETDEDEYVICRATSPFQEKSTAPPGAQASISCTVKMPKPITRQETVAKRSFAQQVRSADLEAPTKFNSPRRPTSLGSAIPRTSSRTAASPTSTRSRSLTGSPSTPRLFRSPSNSKIPILNRSNRSSINKSSPSPTRSLPSDHRISPSSRRSPPSCASLKTSPQTLRRELVPAQNDMSADATNEVVNKDFRKSVLNMNLDEKTLEEYLRRQEEERRRHGGQEGDVRADEEEATTTSSETTSEEKPLSRSASKVMRTSSKTKLVEGDVRRSNSRTIVTRSPSQNRLFKKGSRDNMLAGGNSSDRIYERSRNGSAANVIDGTTTATSDEEDDSCRQRLRLRRRRKGSKDDVLEGERSPRGRGSKERVLDGPFTVAPSPRSSSTNIPSVVLAKERSEYERQDSSSSCMTSSSSDAGENDAVAPPEVKITAHTSGEEGERGDDETSEEETSEEEETDEDEVASLAVTPVPLVSSTEDIKAVQAVEVPIEICADEAEAESEVEEKKNESSSEQLQSEQEESTSVTTDEDHEKIVSRTGGQEKVVSETDEEEKQSALSTEEEVSSEAESEEEVKGEDDEMEGRCSTAIQLDECVTESGEIAAKNLDAEDNVEKEVVSEGELRSASDEDEEEASKEIEEGMIEGETKEICDATSDSEEEEIQVSQKPPTYEKTSSEEVSSSDEEDEEDEKKDQKDASAPVTPEVTAEALPFAQMLSKTGSQTSFLQGAKITPVQTPVVSPSPPVSGLTCSPTLLIRAVTPSTPPVASPPVFTTDASSTLLSPSPGLSPSYNRTAMPYIRQQSSQDSIEHDERDSTVAAEPCSLSPSSHPISSSVNRIASQFGGAATTTVHEATRPKPPSVLNLTHTTLSPAPTDTARRSPDTKQSTSPVRPAPMTAEAFLDAYKKSRAIPVSPVATPTSTLWSPPGIPAGEKSWSLKSPEKETAALNKCPSYTEKAQERASQPSITTRTTRGWSPPSVLAGEKSRNARSPEKETVQLHKSPSHTEKPQAAVSTSLLSPLTVSTSPPYAHPPSPKPLVRHTTPEPASKVDSTPAKSAEAILSEYKKSQLLLASSPVAAPQPTTPGREAGRQKSPEKPSPDTTQQTAGSGFGYRRFRVPPVGSSSYTRPTSPVRSRQRPQDTCTTAAAEAKDVKPEGYRRSRVAQPESSPSPTATRSLAKSPERNVVPRSRTAAATQIFTGTLPHENKQTTPVTPFSGSVRSRQRPAEAAPVSPGVPAPTEQKPQVPETAPSTSSYSRFRRREPEKPATTTAPAVSAPQQAAKVAPAAQCSQAQKSQIPGSQNSTVAQTTPPQKPPEPTINTATRQKTAEDFLKDYKQSRDALSKSDSYSHIKSPSVLAAQKNFLGSDTAPLSAAPKTQPTVVTPKPPEPHKKPQDPVPLVQLTVLPAQAPKTAAIPPALIPAPTPRTVPTQEAKTPTYRQASKPSPPSAPQPLKTTVPTPVPPTRTTPQARPYGPGVSPVPTVPKPTIPPVRKPEEQKRASTLPRSTGARARTATPSGSTTLPRQPKKQQTKFIGTCKDIDSFLEYGDEPETFEEFEDKFEKATATPEPKLFIGKFKDIDDMLGAPTMEVGKISASIKAKFERDPRRRGESESESDTDDSLEEVTVNAVKVHESRQPMRPQWRPQEIDASAVRIRQPNMMQGQITRRPRQKLDDCTLQLYKFSDAEGDYGTYLDLESTIDEQNDDFEGFLDNRKNAVLLRTQLSVRVHAIIEKLLNSTGRELRRALFSLKQIFQDDKDLVHEFVQNDGLACLIKVGSEADQNYQNYILRALGQVMLYVDGMNGVIEHSETIQWLYSLIASKYRLVVKTALKLLLVFVEYTETNSALLMSAVNAVDSERGTKPWSNIMTLLNERDSADMELLVYSMTLMNKTLNGIPDQDTYYDIVDSLEEQGMERLIQHYMSKQGTDLDLLQQFKIYEAVLKHEDGDGDGKPLPMDIRVSRQVPRSRKLSSDENERRKSRRHSLGNLVPSTTSFKPRTSPLAKTPENTTQVSTPSPQWRRRDVNQNEESLKNANHQKNHIPLNDEEPEIDDVVNGITPALRRRRERDARNRCLIKEQEENNRDIINVPETPVNRVSHVAENHVQHGPSLIERTRSRFESRIEDENQKNQQLSQQMQNKAQQQQQQVSTAAQQRQRPTSLHIEQHKPPPFPSPTVPKVDQVPNKSPQPYVSPLQPNRADPNKKSWMLSMMYGKNQEEENSREEEVVHPPQQMKRETVREVQGRMFNRNAEPPLRSPTSEPITDTSGIVSRAKEGLAASRVPRTDLRALIPQSSSASIPDLLWKSDNDLQWEQLVKSIRRPLLINDLDFTDLRDDDDADILATQPLTNGAPPPFGCPPPPPPHINGPPPPPPFMNGPPPPPPPMSGPPPPPPPMGGRGPMMNGGPPQPPWMQRQQAQQAPVQNTIAKNKKTVKLFWKEVRVDPNIVSKTPKKKTIWDELGRVPVDTQKLEHLFENRAKEVLNREKNQEGKKTEIIVLDAKRSNAINIGMTKLPPPRTIKTAILKMDSTIMSKEGIEKILTTMMPSEDEKNKIMEAQMANPDIPLGNAEQFLLTLASITELEARLRLWAFRLDYDVMEKEVAEPLMDLKQAIVEIEGNRTFRIVLATLLSIGNFLNGAEVKGFQIDYLSKVPEVKDTVHKHSLLHHVCHMVMEKDPNTTDLYSEIGAVTRSSKVDYDEVAKNLGKMESDCKASWEHLKVIAKHDGSAMKVKLSEFLADSAERIVVLGIIHRRVMNRFQKLLVYLGCPTHAIKETKVQQVCKTISEFALEYRTTRERVQQQLEKKANHRERNKTRGKMITDTDKFRVTKEQQADQELRQLLGNSSDLDDSKGSKWGTIPGMRVRPRVPAGPGGTLGRHSTPNRDDNMTDADDEILESLVKTATAKPGQNEPRLRKKARYGDRKSLRRTLKSGLDLSEEERRFLTAMSS
ncbi:mucin-12-like isoform X2 [Ornithodoros turicata]|uniref:mucin-12-like isoform X2 n=1 Tax=Ornithodoros turicata TaxID=34597 RepID=UPI0031393623